MPSASPGVSVRLRHYITLVTQAVPLVALTIITWRTFNPATLLILIPLTITAAGPLLELNGRRWGRYLTLGGFSLQVAGMIFLFAMILSMGSWQYIRWSDLALLVLFVPPLALLIWNWRAGRESKPTPAASGSDQIIS